LQQGDHRLPTATNPIDRVLRCEGFVAQEQNTVLALGDNGSNRIGNRAIGARQREGR